MRKVNDFFIGLLVFVFIVILSSPAFPASDLEGGIKELAQQISKNMTTGNKKKIAIIEFSDLDGNITAFGQFLAEELISQLFMISPGQFEVVERRQLMKVLNEQKLTMTGLLDATAMESVGKILGIEAIVTGSLTDLGNTVKVNARLLGVDTAKVFAVAQTKIPKVGTVTTLMERMSAPAQTFTPSGNSQGRQVSNVRSNRGQSGSSPSFQNSFVRVTLKSISKSKDNTKVNLVIELKNISKGDLLIVMKSTSVYVKAQLLDDQGVQFLPISRSKLNGIESTNSPTPNKREYSVFSPGARNTIAWHLNQMKNRRVNPLASVPIFINIPMNRQSHSPLDFQI